MVFFVGIFWFAYAKYETFFALSSHIKVTQNAWISSVRFLRDCAWDRLKDEVVRECGPLPSYPNSVFLCRDRRWVVMEWEWIQCPNWSIFIPLAARRLALRPLSTRELRAALQESGIGADTPAGKSVVSGLSGLGGLALGVVKGIGGSILFDVVTSNVTIEYLTSLLNSTSSSSTTSSSGTAQEICFNSRSVDGDIINGRSNDEVYDDIDPSGEWRQSSTGTASVTTGATGTTTSGSSGITCIVLGSKGSRRRRQLYIRPGTLRSESPRRRRSHRQSHRRFRRSRRWIIIIVP